MKKFKYIFLMLALGTMACTDLEEKPIGLLSPEGFFQAPADVQTAVNGAYGHLQHEDWWGRKMTVTIMLRSDMVDIGDPGTPSRRQDHNYFNVQADNGTITNFWPRSYQTVAAANEAIAGAATLTEFQPEIINPVTAQGYFVRAFIYYHLVRQFGDIPYISEPVSDVGEALTIPRTPAAEVYQRIIADLEFAKTWLPDVQPNRALPSKATAAAYLASVYLTIGDYAKSYEQAKFVIDNEGTFDLSLVADFQDLFNADKQNGFKEALFTLDYNGFRDGDYGQDYQAALTGIRANEKGGIGGGWSVQVPNINVYDAWDGRDYRKSVSLDTVGIFGGVAEPFTKFPAFDPRNKPNAYIAKYTRFPGLTSNGNGRGSSTNYAMMRYAEVLLIAAEALNETSPGSTEAAGYVNRVRERARNQTGTFPADVAAGLSQDEFRTMVLDERKWELAFEYKRWYDIARRQLGEEAFGPNGLEPQPNFTPSRDYLMPIPADELVRNPNLEPQNSGY